MKEPYKILVIGAALTLISHQVNGAEARSAGLGKDFVVVASGEDEIHLMLGAPATLAEMKPYPIRPKVDRVEITGDLLKVTQKIADREELRTYKIRVESGTAPVKPRGTSREQGAGKPAAEPETPIGKQEPEPT